MDQKIIEQYLFQKEELNRQVEYYKSLSEVHLSELEDLRTPQEMIMVAKGIMIHMESDLIFFLKKGKETEKSKEQQERIAILGAVINSFDKIATNNYQMKIMLRAASKELWIEKNQHEDTKRSLKIANELLNAK